MSKSAYIRARIEPELKAKAELVFHELGVTTSQVLNMLYVQVSRTRKIPLELHLPNAETERAIKEARKGRGVTVHKDADDLFDDLGI